MYLIEIKEQNIKMNPISESDNFSISWFGDMDVLSRFIFGFDPDMEILLKDHGFDDDIVDNIIEISKKLFSF